MEIIKVMNNSLVFAKDKDNNEMVVMGKGIGFMKKVGEKLDSSKIEKIFTLKDEVSKNKYVRVIEDMPSEYIDITNNIIRHATDKLKRKLNDSVFISLIDHIAFAIERYHKNVNLQNRLLWEIKKFYPEEFSVGIYALNHINSSLNINLPEEEAGNIAFHIVNAQTEDNQMENTILMVKMMKDILNIIKYDLKIEIDKDSLNYSRFITHLQFFLQRLIEGKLVSNKNNFILEQVEKQYPEKVRCARLVKEYAENIIDTKISDDEVLYLSMHIIRVAGD